MLKHESNSRLRCAWAACAALPLAALAILAVAMASGLQASSVNGQAGCVLMLLLVAAAIVDLKTRKIPNALTYSGIILGLLLAALHSSILMQSKSALDRSDPPAAATLTSQTIGDRAQLFSPVGLPESLLGSFICFGLMLPIYVTAGGAGDVKLAAAIGSLLGVQQGVTALVATYVVAAFWILMRLAWTRGPLAIAEAAYRAVGAQFLPHRIVGPTHKQESLFAGKIVMAPFFALGTLGVACGLFEQLAMFLKTHT